MDVPAIFIPGGSMRPGPNMTTSLVAGDIIEKILSERAKAGILPPEPRKGFFKRYTENALSAMKGAGLE